MALLGLPVTAQTVTTYDFEDGNAMFTADSRISVTVVEGKQTMYSTDFTPDGKAVKFTGASNAQNGYSFAHFDFSSLCNQAAKVKVEFEAVLGNGARSRISIGDASVRGNGSAICSKTTYGAKGAIFMIGTEKTVGYLNGTNNSGLLTGLTQKWLKVTVEVDEQAKTYTYSIVDKETGTVLYDNGETPISFWQSDATNCTQIDMFGYINNSQMGLIDNLVITVTKDERQQASYTVNFLDKDSQPIKEAVTRDGAVGDPITLLPADKDPLWNAEGTQKYIYKSDDTEGLTIAEDGSTVVNITYRDAAVYNYTVVSNLGANLASGTGFEGENLRVGYPRYQLVDNKLYMANVDNKEYRTTVSLTADNVSNTVNYTLQEGKVAVFYTEAENIEGITIATNDNIPVRASGAVAATTAEDILITNIPNGKYKFHVGIFTSKSSYDGIAVNFGIGTETFAAAFSAVNLNEVVSEEYELNSASTPIRYLASSSADTQFDYIWIEKTGDAELAFDPNSAIVNAGFNPEADPLGWDKVTSAQFFDLGMGLIGTYQVRGEHPVATVDETHLATEFAAGLECRWSTNYAAFTQTTAELPAGAYKLTFDVENTNATTTKANYENRFNVTVGETTYADESTEWMDGKSAWTTHTIAFTLTEASPITISLGYGTGSNNFGVGNTPALFVSHLNLDYEAVSALDLALIELKAAIDAAKAKLASYPVGDVYFTYPASEISGLAFLIGIAEGTYNAAESVEAVKEATKNLNDYVATFKPIMQIPTEGKAYYIANKTAEGNLCIGTEKVTIAKDAAVFFTKAEGGFVLSNEEGNYILKTADNNWTLSTTTNKDEAYVVNFNFVDGDYTIQGAKGLFGTDNATEGSTVYANKAQANNGLWTITAVPEFKPAYGTLWADGETTTDENENTIITLDNKYFKDFVKVGDTIRVAITNVGTQPASSRRVIHDGKIALVSGDAEQIEDGIALGATGVDFTFNEEQLTAIQAGNNVKLVYSYLTVTQVELTEMKKEQLINNGTYYIAAAEHISSENPTYMAAGNAWGTHGIVNNAGLDLDVTYNTASKDYYIDTRISNGGDNHYLGSGLYMDAPAFGWKIEEVTNGFNIYGMFDGVKQYISAANDGNLVLSETPYPWIFIHISNWNAAMRATLNEATAEKGVDATFLLKNPNFNRNDQRVAAWVVSEDCKNWNLNGGNNVNNCAESYQSTFTISQIAEGAPKGIYAVTAQGFYRQDTEGDFALPYFFANDEKANFPLKTGSENNMTDASVSFTNGLYTIDPIYVEVAENGTLTVGTKSETANFWCIWDNFKLTYYGANATMDEVKNGAIVKELADLRAKAQNMLADIEVDAVKNAINDALTATADVTGADAINAAIATMKAVIEKGEASIIAKNVLPKMKQLTEETNLYTAEALNTYYTQWEVKYLDGSLTKTEAMTNLQDPFLVTGWHASVTCDNFLLSAWDTNPDFQDAPYYINTWSTEGENDGSEFKVPFFEYWTGDGESLGARTLTATMSNLEAGNYEVTTWVRVRYKNGAETPAYGITMQANDGEAVNACDGDQISDSQFFIKNVTAVGTVGEDGVLKIKFNVAAENNISWLSFKNVKFKKSIAIEAPTFSVAEGEYLGGVSVMLTSATEGAAIYYTTDGTEPNAESTLYSEAIAITETTTVKAVAILEGKASAVAEATYTISMPEYDDKCIYSWMSPNGVAVEMGGTIAGGNGEDRINYSQANYYTICLRGKADFTTQYVTITLREGDDYTLNAGDKIEITAFRNKDAIGKKSGVKLQFGDDTAITTGDGNEFVNLHSAVAESSEYGTEPNTISVTVPEAVANCKEVKLTRSQTGTNLFITKLEIIKAGGTGITSITADSLNDTIYNLNGQKVEKATKGLYIINGKKVVKK